MSVRAKFKVVSITKTEHGDAVRLQPVTSNSPENAEFYKWTPTGQIDLSTVNAEAAKQFEVGKEFYVDFTQAAQ